MQKQIAYSQGKSGSQSYFFRSNIRDQNRAYFTLLTPQLNKIRLLSIGFDLSPRIMSRKVFDQVVENILQAKMIVFNNVRCRIVCLERKLCEIFPLTIIGGMGDHDARGFHFGPHSMREFDTNIVGTTRNLVVMLLFPSRITLPEEIKIGFYVHFRIKQGAFPERKPCHSELDSESLGINQRRKHY